MGKDISGCGIFGMMDVTGRLISGEEVIKAIDTMNYRYNGLGGGFAGYGIYPKYADCYALHVHIMNPEAKLAVENFLYERLTVVKDEEIPHRKVAEIDDNGIINWRYFVKPPEEEGNPDDYIVKIVMHINISIPDAYVFSSGKNMGVFKAVGYPAKVAEYYKIESYNAYTWIAHGRYPTNTPGWWGGAHPFNILDWSVVHNGEISSYGTNKNFLEMWGYKCTLLTDTEVVAYLFDLLVRRHGLPLELACKAMAPPFWAQINNNYDKQAKVLRAIRMTYPGALLNGPFSIIVATNRFMLGLGDRIKLRPLIAAQKDNVYYISSEECAIKTVCQNPDRVWAPRAGEPVIIYMQPS
ncbi:MAG TPA: hypothetical protein ENF42_00170 [Candidatus Bathyarchaeota archaeon]|nr:hypothetical protein [Candidatus Bathyarchaeota archaeon]